MPLRRGLPVWLDSGRARARYPELTGRLEVDVAIVGGGLTGSLAALAFATAGVRVALVEGGLVGHGSTAASSALLLKDPDRGLAELADRYGLHSAQRVWRACHRAVRDFVATLECHRIHCDLARRDAVYLARSQQAAGVLHAEYLLRRRSGFSGEWLTPGAVRRMTGISGFGAIRTSGNAQLDPYRACAGVMTAARSAGALLFERSRVVRTAQTRTGIRVYTARGRVDAGRVVIATGYATAQFKPLAGRFRMDRTYVLATHPVTTHEKHELGFGPALLWDTEEPYHYMRWTPEGRLLLGGCDRPVRSGRRRAVEFARGIRQLRDDCQQMLPALVDVPVDKAWEGLFAVTPDSLPYIGPHRRYPRHLFALGYGGNGMTFASLAARLLLEYWKGTSTAEQRLFSFGRFR